MPSVILLPSSPLLHASGAYSTIPCPSVGGCPPAQLRVRIELIRNLPLENNQTATRHYCLDELHFCCCPFPPQFYDTASETNASSRPPAPPPFLGSTLSSSRLIVALFWAMTLMQCLALQGAGDAVTPWAEMQDLLQSS
jgi:hypothetical protein